MNLTLLASGMFFTMIFHVMQLTYKSHVDIGVADIYVMYVPGPRPKIF